MSRARTEGNHAVPTRGVVYVHCCPSAIAPHVEWALAGVLGTPVRLQWSAQPSAPAHLRAQAAWRGPVGHAARLSAALRAWPMLIFEITEDGTTTSDGERLAYVPGRGFHRSAVAANGDVVVGENGCGGCWTGPGRQMSSGTAWPTCWAPRGMQSWSPTASAGGRRARHPAPPGHLTRPRPGGQPRAERRG